MNLNVTYPRIVSSFIASIFITTFVCIAKPISHESILTHFLLGLTLSAIFSSFLIGVDTLFRKCNLKTFNTIVLGLCVGIFLGKSLVTIFDTLLIIANLSFTPLFIISLTKILLTLTSIHLGITLTTTYQEDLHISIPFFRFNKESMKDKKDVVLDETILSDPRIFDFLSTGILNNCLILPSFLLKSIQDKIENGEDHVKANAKKLLSIIDKLKAMENLELKENETDFTDIIDVKKKTLKLAKLTHSKILIADSSKLDSEDSEVQFLSLNTIANSLKNMMSTGETIEIKVQRYGKEPKQGVGYLEDGTMVVINNGGEFIGEVIETQVISVKQTSAGRIIFTNAIVDSEEREFAYEIGSSYENGQQ